MREPLPSEAAWEEGLGCPARSSCLLHNQVHWSQTLILYFSLNASSSFSISVLNLYLPQTAWVLCWCLTARALPHPGPAATPSPWKHPGEACRPPGASWEGPLQCPRPLSWNPPFTDSPGAGTPGPSLSLGTEYLDAVLG